MSDTATAVLNGDNGGTASAGATSAPTPAGNNATWSATFDEGTQAYVSAKGWQSPADLLTSYRNLEKFAGGSKNLVELPGVDADPSAWDSVYNKLGRPESPEKYGLEVPQGGDPELVNWFGKTAHKLGLTDKQAKALYTEWNGMTGNMQQQMAQQMAQESERAIGSLKQEWGQGFDKMIDSGKRAVRALGLDEGKLSEYEAKLGTADMLKLFATLGQKMGEDSFEGGERSGSGSFGMTPAVARQQIAELRSDNRFMGEYIKGNPDAVNKMKRLMEAAYE
jgi:hypothetical protein